MKQIINSFLFYCKIILLLIAFTLTLYIIFSMNAYYRHDVVNMFLVGLPLFLVLLFFVFSIFKDNIKENLLFNIASVLGIIAIIIIDYRTIFDKNMVLWQNGKMNFYYFNSALNEIKIFSYIIFTGNLLLFITNNKMSNKE